MRNTVLPIKREMYAKVREVCVRRHRSIVSAVSEAMSAWLDLYEGMGPEPTQAEVGLPEPVRLLREEAAMRKEVRRSLGNRVADMRWAARKAEEEMRRLYDAKNELLHRSFGLRGALKARKKATEEWRAASRKARELRQAWRDERKATGAKV
jgi:hypothetical protein